MADDTLEIHEAVDSHPCDTPRGMLYYDLDVLTKDQRLKLNKLKRDTVRHDEKYLAAHPEVRAIVSMIYRKILRERPRTDLHEHIALIFAKERDLLQKEIDSYIHGRVGHVYEGNSSVGLYRNVEHDLGEVLEKQLSVEDIVESFNISEIISKDMLNMLLIKVFTRLRLDDKNELDATSLEKAASTVLTESLFNIFTGVAEKSKELVRDLVEKEILNRIDEFAEKIKERYELDLHLDDYTLYEKTEGTEDRGSVTTEGIPPLSLEPNLESSELIVRDELESIVDMAVDLEQELNVIELARGSESDEDKVGKNMDEKPTHVAEKLIVGKVAVDDTIVEETVEETDKELVKRSDEMLEVGKDVLETVEEIEEIVEDIGEAVGETEKIVEDIEDKVEETEKTDEGTAEEAAKEIVEEIIGSTVKEIDETVIEETEAEPVDDGAGENLSETVGDN